MTSPTEPTPTEHPDDLERVEVRPRAQRGAIVSVRLTPAEASLLGDMATRTGLSVSELARNVLRQAIATDWRLRVWRPGVYTTVFETGGDFAATYYPPAPAREGIEHGIWVGNHERRVCTG